MAAGTTRSETISSRLQRGSPAYRRAALALIAAGFANFALLYSVQTLMPSFTAYFGISPATSALSLSVTMAAVASMLIFASSASESWGRRNMIIGSIIGSGAFTVAASMMPDFGGLLAMRVLVGISMSGLPAIVMAYLAEEIEPGSLGAATGIVVGGNAIGGMSGRFVAGFLVDLGGWRLSLGVLGLLGIAAGFLCWRLLPPSRHFRAKPLQFGPLLRSLLANYRDPGLRWLFALGFILNGCFITFFNYVGFRLLAPPYGLSQSVIGAIFILYLLGSVSSAGMGRLADLVGRGRVLWAAIALILAGLLLSLRPELPVIILGAAMMITGYFGSHALASSWVARRATAKAQASALYLFGYYVGSSVLGYVGGLIWAAQGWPGVVALLGGLLTLAVMIALRLAWYRES